MRAGRPRSRGGNQRPARCRSIQSLQIMTVAPQLSCPIANFAKGSRSWSFPSFFHPCGHKSVRSALTLLQTAGVRLGVLHAVFPSDAARMAVLGRQEEARARGLRTGPLNRHLETLRQRLAACRAHRPRRPAVGRRRQLHYQVRIRGRGDLDLSQVAASVHPAGVSHIPVGDREAAVPKRHVARRNFLAEQDPQ